VSDKIWVRAVVLAVIAVAGGLAIGIGTQILQGWLPGSWGVLANSGVGWALGAAVVGMFMPTDRAAAVAGAVAMVLASNSYYWAVEWFEHSSSDGRGALLWSLAGLVAGPVFGIAGRWIWTDGGRRWLGASPVAGILTAEGIYLMWYVGVDDLRPAGAVELALGAVLAVWVLVRSSSKLAVLGLIIGSAAAFFVAEQIIDAGFLL
jgi:hypothetical protein